MMRCLTPVTISHLEDSVAVMEQESEALVGSKFQFKPAERELIKGAVTDYDKKAKSTARDMSALNVSSLVVDSARSRCALITEKMEYSDDDSVVELDYKLRSTLGDALSMHARKLAKIRDKTLPDMLVDTSDVEEAAERTACIANKIGEQLTMHLESGEEE